MARYEEWAEKHTVFHLIIFTIVYFTWFILLEKFRTPAIILETRLDARIPFIKYFVVPYMGWFVYMLGFLLFFLLKSKEDFDNATRYMFTGMIIALIIYTIIPTGLNLRPEISGNDIFSLIVAKVYSTDTPTNVCPSLHVFNSIAVNAVVQRSRAFKHPNIVKPAAYLACILICMSTVFLKQHSIIDVFWALVMAVALYPLSYARFRELKSRWQQVTEKVTF